MNREYKQIEPKEFEFSPEFLAMTIFIMAVTLFFGVIFMIVSLANWSIDMSSEYYKITYLEYMKEGIAEFFNNAKLFLERLY